MTSLLFGLARQASGSSYVALRTGVGVGYSAAAAACRQVAGGVAAHGALNAVHFFNFSYPGRDLRAARR